MTGSGGSGTGGRERACGGRLGGGPLASSAAACRASSSRAGVIADGGATPIMVRLAETWAAEGGCPEGGAALCGARAASTKPGGGATPSIVPRGSEAAERGGGGRWLGG